MAKKIEKEIRDTFNGELSVTENVCDMMFSNIVLITSLLREIEIRSEDLRNKKNG